MKNKSSIRKNWSPRIRNIFHFCLFWPQLPTMGYQPHFLPNHSYAFLSLVYSEGSLYRSKDNKMNSHNKHNTYARKIDDFEEEKKIEWKHSLGTMDSHPLLCILFTPYHLFYLCHFQKYNNCATPSKNRKLIPLIFSQLLCMAFTH